MSECLGLLLARLRGALRDRSDLVAENLLLRHRLAVLTRPPRRRPRLRARDKLLWVLARRLRVGVSAHPTAAWVWRQLVAATAWGRRPRHLVRNRDAVYGGDFITERLDHLLPLDERHLRPVLAEYAAASNTERPHRSLGLEPPLARARLPNGSIRARPVLGGLHHV